MNHAVFHADQPGLKLILAAGIRPVPQAVGISGGEGVVVGRLLFRGPRRGWGGRFWPGRPELPVTASRRGRAFRPGPASAAPARRALPEPRAGFSAGAGAAGTAGTAGAGFSPGGPARRRLQPVSQLVSRLVFPLVSQLVFQPVSQPVFPLASHSAPAGFSAGFSAGVFAHGWYWRHAVARPAASPRA